jgi:hypothetical protein
MAISNSLGLGMLGSAQQGHTTISNTSGYQNAAMWDQDRAYREEMIRREERARMEQRYREEIMRYGYAVPDEVIKKSPVKKEATDTFPEGHQKTLLLLLEN